MLNFKRPFAATIWLALALLPSAAAADPITVTDGFLGISAGRSPFRPFSMSLLGDRAFAISATPPEGFVDSDFNPPCTFVPCPAGMTTNLSGTVSVAGAMGSATINGTHYPVIRATGGEFSFSSNGIVIPEPTSSVLSLSSPFTFGGSLAVSALDASNRFSSVGSFDLIGQGIATGIFDRSGPAPPSGRTRSQRTTRGRSAPRPASGRHRPKSRSTLSTTHPLAS